MQREIPPDSLELVDWNAVYLTLLEYKETKGYANLLVHRERLRDIVGSKDAYELVADESIIEPKSHADRQRLREAVTNILRR